MSNFVFLCLIRLGNKLTKGVISPLRNSWNVVPLFSPRDLQLMMKIKIGLQFQEVVSQAIVSVVGLWASALCI